MALRRIILLLLVASCALPAQQKYRKAVLVHMSEGNILYDDYGNTYANDVPVSMVAYNGAHSLHGNPDSVWMTKLQANTITGFVDPEYGQPTYGMTFFQWWYYINGNYLSPVCAQYPVVIMKQCPTQIGINMPWGSSADTIAPVPIEQLKQTVYQQKWYIRKTVRMLRDKYPANFFVWMTCTPLCSRYVYGAGADSTNRDMYRLAHWMKDTLSQGIDAEFGVFPRNVFVYDIYSKLCTGADSSYRMQARFNRGDSMHTNPLSGQFQDSTMVREIFNAALTFEVGPINPSTYSLLKVPHYPLRAYMPWTGGCDWYMQRFDLVVAVLQDSAIVKKARLIRDSTYYVATKDWHAGAYLQGIIPPEYIVRTTAGAYLPYGNSNGTLDLTEYCSPLSTNGTPRKANVFTADTIAQLLNWWNGTSGVWDGAFSDCVNHTYYESNVSLTRNSVATSSYEKERAVHEGMSIALQRLRVNWGQRGGLFSGWNIASGTQLGVGNVDTMALDFSNGSFWEDAQGNNNLHISGTDNFASWKPIADGWRTYHKQNPVIIGIMTVVDRDRGHTPGDARYKENWQFVRFWLAWGSLTDTYIAFQSSDNGPYSLFSGVEHDDALYYDEMDIHLGQPTALVAQYISTCVNFWYRPFQRGIILFSGDYTSPQVITQAQLTALGLPGPYYRFKGGEDTVTNTGAVFSSVTFTPHNLSNPIPGTTYYLNVGDALFLLTSPDTVVADVIVDNANFPTAPGSLPAVLNGFSYDAGASSGGSNDCNGPLYKNPTYSTAIRTSNELSQYYRQHYTTAALGGTSTATYTPQLNVAGWYDVYEWHGFYGAHTSPGNGENTAVPVRINTATGYKDTTVNQAVNAGQWNYMGRYSYTPTSNNALVLSNNTNPANGAYVLADAFRWKLVTTTTVVTPPPPPVQGTGDKRVIYIK